jgi:hypothetical protein
MKEKIYFIYATERVPIIPIYHPILTMHTTLYHNLIRGGIQLI